VLPDFDRIKMKFRSRAFVCLSFHYARFSYARMDDATVQHWKFDCNYYHSFNDQFAKFDNEVSITDMLIRIISLCNLWM